MRNSTKKGTVYSKTDPYRERCMYCGAYTDLHKNPCWIALPITKPSTEKGTSSDTKEGIR